MNPALHQAVERITRGECYQFKSVGEDKVSITIEGEETAIFSMEDVDKAIMERFERTAQLKNEKTITLDMAVEWFSNLVFLAANLDSLETGGKYYRGIRYYY